MDQDVATGKQSDLPGQGKDRVARRAEARDERRADESMAAGDGDDEILFHCSTPAAEAA
jgi:hypothetical protein